MWIGFRRNKQTNNDTEETISSKTLKDIPRILKIIATKNVDNNFKSQVNIISPDKDEPSMYGNILYGTPFITKDSEWMDKYPHESKTHLIQFHTNLDNEKVIIQIWAVDIDKWKSSSDINIIANKITGKTINYIYEVNNKSLIKEFKHAFKLNLTKDYIFRPFSDQLYLEHLAKTFKLKKIPVKTSDAENVYDLIIKRDSGINSLEDLYNKLPDIIDFYPKSSVIIDNKSKVFKTELKYFAKHNNIKSFMTKHTLDKKLIAVVYLDSLYHETIPVFNNTASLFGLEVYYDEVSKDVIVEPLFNY